MGGVADFIGDVFDGVVGFVVDIFQGFMGAFGMSFDTPEMSGQSNYDAVAKGITVNKQSNVAGIPVVYGKRKVGGVRTFVATKGEDNKYLYICLAVAEGEINGFTKIYINDEAQNISSFPVNPTNTTTVDVPNDSKFFVDGSARAKFQFFTGTEDQQYSQLLGEHGNWGSEHRLRGVAYVACRFEWVKADFADDNSGDQTLFNPWQGIPVINVEIEGKKVLTNYPNSGSGASLSNAKDTNNDTSSYGTDYSSGFSYSNNPADCLMDYLRSPRFGKGLNDNRIDFKAFQLARAICDTNKNFSSPLSSAHFLDCNTHIDVEETMFENTKKILQTCRGFLPYTNGKYQLKIEAGETAPENLLTITDEMIIGSISVSSEEKNAKYNEAHMTFSNEEKQYESDTAIYKADGSTINGVATNDHLATDGEPLILKMAAPGITRRERALQYAEYMVERSRKQLQVSFTATTEAQNLVAGDLVMVVHRYEHIDKATGTAKYDYLFNSVANSEATSYTNPKKIFRVISQKLNYDGTVDLILLEHQNSIYDVRVQSEDKDLSPISTIRPSVPTWPVKPTPPVKLPPVASQKFKIETAYNMDNGVKRAQIRTNNVSHSDAFATHYIYTLKNGSNQEDRLTPYLDSRINYYNKINNSFLPFNSTIEVKIYSLYNNGQKNLVETQTVTTPADPNAVSSGGI